MSEPQNKEVPMPVRLDSKDAEFLDSLKLRTGISVSALIRAAVKIYIEHAKKTGCLPFDPSALNSTPDRAAEVLTPRPGKWPSPPRKG